MGNNILAHHLVTRSEIERDTESITLNLFCEEGDAQELLDTLPMWVTRWGEPVIGNESGSCVAIHLVHRESLAALIRVAENLIREMERLGPLLKWADQQSGNGLWPGVRPDDYDGTESFFYAIKKAKEIIQYDE